MKHFLILTLLLTTASVSANSPSRKIFCEDNLYKNLVTADITKGIIILADSDGNIMDKLEDLVVTGKKIGDQEVIRFKTSDLNNDLPRVIFEAKVDAFGNGTAKSYNDKSGGTTTFNCGVKYLDL
jgi:hypothetical protein